jgi:hypothetical protein
MPGHHPCVMPCQHSFHVSEGMVDRRWSGFGEICEQYWFFGEDDRWSMVDDRASMRFVGNFWFAEKNGRWSMVGDRALGRSVGRFGSQRKSMILDH